MLLELVQFDESSTRHSCARPCQSIQHLCKSTEFDLSRFPASIHATGSNFGSPKSSETLESVLISTSVTGISVDGFSPAYSATQFLTYGLETNNTVVILR
ncbi:hypothetical protein RRG08_024143 [Elysia crispata]|uniref:Uncharacterized protein n=1 Tax=Elysia crispata TaxID=231223 RepID=A0AAE0YR61_9GAST|nr:hypothetical protein RRG08_024143 [Elysia crispata]